MPAAAADIRLTAAVAAAPAVISKAWHKLAPELIQWSEVVAVLAHQPAQMVPMAELQAGIVSHLLAVAVAAVDIQVDLEMAAMAEAEVVMVITKVQVVVELVAGAAILVPIRTIIIDQVSPPESRATVLVLVHTVSKCRQVRKDIQEVKELAIGLLDREQVRAVEE